MYIDSNNNILDTSQFKYFDEGKCARIYKDNNILLKIYKDDCRLDYYFSPKVFDKLKTLNLSSFVKLYNYYHENHLKKWYIPILSEMVYTMQYINNPHIFLLDQKKEYLLDIISKFEKDIIILTNNGIKMSDAHYSNIIFQDNSATIIDIDLFRYAKLINDKKLLLHNKEQLLSYIISTLRYELKEKKLYNFRFEYIFCPSELLFMNVIDYLKTVITEDTIEQSLIKKL